MRNRSEYLQGFARRCLILAVCAILVGNARLATSAEPKAAEPATQAANDSVRSRLPFANRDDYQDAERGFIGTLPDALVNGTNGNIVWSQADYSFLDREDSPATVNPSQKYLKFQLPCAACSNFCVGYPRMARVPPVLLSA